MGKQKTHAFRVVIVQGQSLTLAVRTAMVTDDSSTMPRWETIGVSKANSFMNEIIDQAVNSTYGTLNHEGKQYEPHEWVAEWRKAFHYAKLLKAPVCQKIRFDESASPAGSSNFEHAFDMAKSMGVSFCVDFPESTEKIVALHYDLGDDASIDYVLNLTATMPAQRVIAQAQELLEEAQQPADLTMAIPIAYRGDLPAIVKIATPAPGYGPTMQSIDVRIDANTGMVLSSGRDAGEIVASIAKECEQSHPGSAEAVLKCFDRRRIASLVTQPFSQGNLYVNTAVAAQYLRETQGEHSDTRLLLLQTVANGYGMLHSYFAPLLHVVPHSVDVILQWSKRQPRGAVFFAMPTNAEHCFGDCEPEFIQTALKAFGYRMDEEPSLSDLDGVGRPIIRILDNEAVEDINDLPPEVLGLAERYCECVGVLSDA